MVKKEVEEEVVWTQSQQRLLELALQQNPRGTAQRWDRIAKLVPGKTKVWSLNTHNPHVHIVFTHNYYIKLTIHLHRILAIHFYFGHWNVSNYFFVFLVYPLSLILFVTTTRVC